MAARRLGNPSGMSSTMADWKIPYQCRVSREKSTRNMDDFSMETSIYNGIYGKSPINLEVLIGKSIQMVDFPLPAIFDDNGG